MSTEWSSGMARRKRSRSESPPLQPLSRKWFVPAFADPEFGDSGTLVHVERDWPISGRGVVRFAVWGSKEPNIDMVDKDPDATYAEDKKNNELALQRMQNSVQNYQQQQAAYHTASLTIQSNLQGYLMIDDDDDLQPSVQSRNTWPMQKLMPNEMQEYSTEVIAPKNESQLDSGQTVTSCRVQNIKSDDMQMTVQSSVYRTTKLQRSENDIPWQMQKLAVDDMQQPSAQLTDYAVQQDSTSATSWRIQRHVTDNKQQRTSKSMAFRIRWQQNPTNATTSWRMQKIVPDDTQRLSTQETASRTALKQEAISTETSWSTEKLVPEDKQQRSAKSMAFRIIPHQNTSATTSWQDQNHPPNAMQLYSELTPSSNTVQKDSCRTQKPDSDDMRHRPGKFLAFRTNLHPNPEGAATSREMQKHVPVMEQCLREVMAPMTAMHQDSAPAMTSWKLQKLASDEMQQRPAKSMAFRSAMNHNSAHNADSGEIQKLETGDMQQLSIQPKVPGTALQKHSVQVQATAPMTTVRSLGSGPCNLASFQDKKPRSSRVRNDHPCWTSDKVGSVHSMIK